MKNKVINCMGGVAKSTLAPALAMTLALTGVAVAETDIEKGNKLAFERKKGNCLACHHIKGGEMAGNIAPPLVAMKDRFPEKSVLRAQIWDATVRNPNTSMPPFGRNNILTEEEIDLVVEYIHSL